MLTKVKYIYLQSAIISLILPTLIIGPFIPDLLISFSAIFFLYYVVSRKDYQVFKSNIFLILIIICLFLIINSLISVNPNLSLESTLFYFRFIIFSFGFYYLIVEYEKILKWVFYFFIIALILINILFFYDLVLSFITEIPMPVRYSGFFGEEKKMGGFLVRTLPIFLSLLYLIFKNINIERLHIILFTILFLFFPLIIFSGERSALILYFISLILIIFSLPNKLKLFSVIFFATIIILTFSFNKNFYDRFITLTFQQLNFENGNIENILFFSSEHQSFAKSALYMFYEKPITGHGPKLFRDLCENYNTIGGGCSSHPHNYYLQMLAENGIIGFFVMFFIFIFFTFNILKMILKNKFLNHDYYSKYLIMIVFFINFFPFMPHGNFFNNWLSTLIFFPLGILLYFSFNSSKKV